MDGSELNLKKTMGKRFACYQPSEKQPRTKDDDEKDSNMTLNRYLVPASRSPTGTSPPH